MGCLGHQCLDLHCLGRGLGVDTAHSPHVNGFLGHGRRRAAREGTAYHCALLAPLLLAAAGNTARLRHPGHNCCHGGVALEQQEAGGNDPHGLADAAQSDLLSLVAEFDRQETPYAALRRRQFARKFDYDDYAHLARVPEWSQGFEGE